MRHRIDFHWSHHDDEYPSPCTTITSSVLVPNRWERSAKGCRVSMYDGLEPHYRACRTACLLGNLRNDDLGRYLGHDSACIDCIFTVPLKVVSATFRTLSHLQNSYKTNKICSDRPPRHPPVSKPLSRVVLSPAKKSLTHKEGGRNGCSMHQQAIRSEPCCHLVAPPYIAATLSS